MHELFARVADLTVGVITDEHTDDVQQRRAFERRPARDREELRTVTSVATCPFGDVQWDRYGSPS